MNPIFRKYLSIFALSMAGGSMYTIAYLRYIFYDAQLEVMGITNLESSLLITIYAVLNIVLCMPGGILADRVAPRTLIMTALFSTSALGVLHALNLSSYPLSLGIWSAFSITTDFLFWCALIKSIGLIGGKDEQGHLYGMYYVGNGIVGALVNMLALHAFTYGDTSEQGLFYAVMVLTGSIFTAGILIFFCLESGKGEITAEEDKFHFSDIRELIKNPMLWCFSFVIFSGYVLFSSNTYFTPYLTNVVGISVEESGGYAIVRNYLFYLLCPISGYIADKIFHSTSKLFVILYALIALSFVGVLFLSPDMNTTLVSIYTLLPGALTLMMYGILFSVMRETGIPTMLIGTAIGLVSFIGYSSEFIFAPLFGYWLDKYGNSGYNYIFTVLIAISIFGMLMSFIIARMGSSDAKLAEQST